jgi:hypothetical protein
MEAMTCRTLEKALDAPTMKQLAVHNSEEQVVAEAVIIMDAAMELFASNRRPPTAHVTEFGWHLMTMFPHESLADINVFAKGCATSRWDDGEYYASVDVPRLTIWWERFMEQKAEALERVERQKRSDRQREMSEGLKGIEGLGDAVAKTVQHTRAEAHEMMMAARLTRMKVWAPTMTDDQLREQWKLNPQGELRSILYAEAMNRGLAQAKMDEITADDGK